MLIGRDGFTEQVTDGRGTTTLAYESGSDRVSSVTDPVTGAVGYTYGISGQRLTMTLPGSATWTYTYQPYTAAMPRDDPNSLGRILEKVTDDQGRICNYYFDHFGRLHLARTNQAFNSGGTLTSYQDCRYYFDVNQSGFGHGWTRQVKNTWNWLNQYGYAQSSVLVQNDYTYDHAGNRLTNQLSDQNGVIRTEQYGYDALSRLTSVNYGDGQTQGYTFDPMGNRLTKTDSANGNDTYTYNNANMLLSRNGGSYTNDLNGNTLTGGGRSNTWDGQNRLTQVVYNGTTTTHTYGADGLRRRTVQGANTTDYLLDDQSVVRTKLNGNVDKTYLHGARGPEYERTGTNSPGWYVYDGLGSVLGITDSSGTFTSMRKYDVYGVVRSFTGSNGSKHKFVGQLGHPSEDETGLIYMRARYYDPVTGGFASEDPARHGTNWFTYATPNPITYYDRTGKESIPSITTGMNGAVSIEGTTIPGLAELSVSGVRVGDAVIWEVHTIRAASTGRIGFRTMFTVIRAWARGQGIQQINIGGIAGSAEGEALMVKLAGFIEAMGGTAAIAQSNGPIGWVYWLL
ncbi:MAG: RHS repeat domain-containing protein [Armatimonadota bacterium]